jgi:hypothetical protein
MCTGATNFVVVVVVVEAQRSFFNLQSSFEVFGGEI